MTWKELETNHSEQWNDHHDAENKEQLGITVNTKNRTRGFLNLQTYLVNETRMLSSK